MARARVRTSQVAWTSGELGPELEGRTDQERYFKGAFDLTNFKLRPLGGVTRRPGTTFVTSGKTGAIRIQMLPFIARANVAYALEFGDVAGAGYIRFFRNNGLIQSTPDLLVNGGFDVNLSGWTATASVAWTAGVARLPSAAELMVNGTFTSSMTGWNVSGTTAVSGVAVISASGFMNQTRAVVPGLTYTFSFRIVAGNVTVSATNTNFVTADYGPGVYSTTFTASATPTVIQFDARPAPGGLANVDDVSLQVQSILQQVATVVAGTPYTLSFRLLNAPVGVSVRVGSAPATMNLLDLSLTTGTYTYIVTSPTSSISVRFGGAGDVDDVKLQAPTGPHEIVSPYLAGDLPLLRLAYSADVAYIACEGHPPRKLTRTSDTGWTLSAISFQPPPTEEQPVTFAGISLTLGAVSGTGVTVTASGSTWLAADVDRQIKAGSGRAVIKTFTNATVVVVDILDAFAATTVVAGGWTLNGSPGTTLTPSKKEPKGASVTLTAGAAAFRAADVDKYVRIQNGLIKINKFTDSQHVDGEILHKLDAITGTTAWSLESESWNVTDGFPIDVGFTAGDRLVWGRGDRVWLSTVGDYENMAPSTLDDDAFTLALRTAEVSEIRWIIGATELQLGSSGAEFIVSGGNDNPLSPTNFKISSDTTYGAARNRALRVNSRTMFVDRSGRGLREQVFSIDENRFVAVDLLQLAQHYFPIGLIINDLAYQRSPDSIVWALRSDGALCALTYLRAEQVVGWWRMVTQGAVESFCVIPHPDGDREQVWVAVRRTINGLTVRYIERIDDTSVFADSAGVTYGQKNTDATLSYTGTPTATPSGLGHLEGASVWVLGDGAFIGTFTVTSGSVTLPAAYSNLEIGLPYTSTLVTVRPEIQVQGTSQSVKKRNARIITRVYRTKSLKANGNALPIPSGALFSGDVANTNLGWDRDGKITLTQDQPLPCTVLLLSSVMGVGA